MSNETSTALPEMENVTAQFQSYRECVRHLWNTHFRARAESEQDWDLRDAFDDVCDKLFGMLVLYPLGLAQLSSDPLRTNLSPARAQAPLFSNDFELVPTSPHGVPILVNRDLPRSGYWDHPFDRIRPGDAVLRLVRWFDFGELSFRDFRYYEVFIEASQTHPETVGRAALLECEYATVHVRRSSSERPDV